MVPQWSWRACTWALVVLVATVAVPVGRAGAAGTAEARLAAYEELRGLLGWLAAGLDEGPFPPHRRE